MVSVKDGTLNRRWLDQVLRHVSRPKIRTACFGPKLGLHIDAYRCIISKCRASGQEACLTLLKQDALKQRVLVAQHQALISGMPVGSLEVCQILLMSANSLFELLDILGAAFPESSLGLTVPLLSLF